MWEAVKNIGLDHCDLPTMLATLSFLLRGVSLNIDKKNKKPISLVFYILLIAMSANYFYVYLFSMAWFVLVRYPQTGDLVAAMVFLSLGLSTEIGTMKLFYFHFHREKLRTIVQEYLACDFRVAAGSRFSNNILKTLRIVKKRATVYWLVIMLNGVVYVTLPIITPGTHLTEDHMVIYGLEPKYETPNFEIAYFMTTVSVFFICYVVSHITAFIIIIVGYNEAQMIALSHEIMNIWDDAINYYLSTTKFDGIAASREMKSKIVNGYVKERLKFIIKTHGNNMSLLHQVEIVLRHCIALGFLFLVLGLIAELLGGLENTFLQLPFALMQVGMDCYTGQKVIDASEMFAAAVYDSKWENFDKTNMKMVLLILMNSRKSMALSAGGLTTLSFGSLMSILKSTYSAYTALRSMI